MRLTTRIALVPVLGLALALAACLDPDDPGNLVPETVDEDPSLPSIEVNGTRLHAEAFGDPSAPMLMMLHGGPGSDYRSLLPYRALANDGYRVVFWDQRGAGLSRRHDASSYVDLDNYLEDLRLVIEHFSRSSRQRIVFIGHSWGAMYATWFINTYGDHGGRVAGAVLSEPGAFTVTGLKEYVGRAFPPWGWFSEDLNDMLWLEQHMSPGDHARADFMRAAVGLSGMPRQHDDPNNPTPMWRQGAVVNFQLNKLGMARGFDWTTNLGKFPHKVLFLRGELNENMPLEHQQELASHYASSEIVTVPGTGHQQLWEKQAECLAHIRAYLAKTGIASTSIPGGVK